RLLRGGDANAGVADGDDNTPRTLMGSKRHGAAVGRVFDRVVDQVGEDLANASGIDFGRKRSADLVADSDLFFLRNHLVEFSGFADDGGEISRLSLESHHASFGFG